MVEITFDMECAALAAYGKDKDGTAMRSALAAVAPLIEAQARGEMENRVWRDLERTHRAIPEEFCLDPPDGGDVKPWEAAERLAKALADTRAELAQARAAAIEEAAKLVESGWRCITCNAVFLAEHGHDCESPNWDGLKDAEMVAAIRALSPRPVSEKEST